MDNITNCPNCGAPVELTEKSCPFCDTPYPGPRRPVVLIEPQTVHIDAQKLAAAVADVAAGVITPNEARRRLGLREI